MRTDDLKGLEARQPGVEHQQVFEQFLKSRVIGTPVQYISSLCRAADILGRRISPVLLPSPDAVSAVIAEMQQGQYKDEKFPMVKTALRRYAEMVAENFNGQFGPPATTTVGKTTNDQSPLGGTIITPLLPKGRRLLEAIVAHLQANEVDHTRPSTFPTYDMMYRAVTPDAPPLVLYVGHNLRRKGLDDLNDWTTANESLPKVTGLIVEKSARRPHDSYFTWYQKEPLRDDGWWREEVRKSLVFDWSRFIGTQQATSPVFIADDLDDDELAPRVKGEISRIVRDTKIVREVKALHDHTCQICGERLELSPGVFYSEAHHLKPLGKPYNGRDKKWNLICVCPNCHVKLDYHAVRICHDQLRMKAGHAVSQQSIDHHNSCCP